MKKFYVLLLVVFFSVIFISCKKDSTTGPTPPTPYEQADGIRGGILYDAFWSTEANYSKKSDTTQVSKFKSHSDFFRCKQCHAWDLMGQSGSYINRGPKTTRPNVAVVNLSALVKTKTEQELFDAIKTGSATRRDISYDLATYNPTSNATIGDQMPKYSQILSDAEIWDLVKFFKKEVNDITQLYDATYTGAYPTGKAAFSNIGKDGNAANGKTYYTSKCKDCHGADGKFIPDLDGTAGMTAGKFIRTKSNEAQHKIKFGQLGTGMTAFKSTPQEMKDLYKALSDTLTFPNN